jgi:pyruvate/2-oxoglutarate/acetoin dehydrogenase E1 component
MPAPDSVSSSDYAGELTRAMDLLAADPRTIFLGQAVAYPGTAQSGTLHNIPPERKLELPVAEDMQMGLSIGLALTGRIPVTCYPRWNFLLLAANQLVNHLDKLPLISGWKPKVIVRVGVGADKPMHPGPQHIGDHTTAFEVMLETIAIARLNHASKVVPEYKKALARAGSTILVEYGALYGA